MLKWIGIQKLCTHQHSGFEIFVRNEVRKLCFTEAFEKNREFAQSSLQIVYASDKPQMAVDTVLHVVVGEPSNPSGAEDRDWRNKDKD